MLREMVMLIYNGSQIHNIRFTLVSYKLLPGIKITLKLTSTFSYNATDVMTRGRPEPKAHWMGDKNHNK
jgi:hypothetical protein